MTELTNTTTVVVDTQEKIHDIFVAFETLWASTKEKIVEYLAVNTPKVFLDYTDFTECTDARIHGNLVFKVLNFSNYELQFILKISADDLLHMEIRSYENGKRSDDNNSHVSSLPLCDSSTNAQDLCTGINNLAIYAGDQLNSWETNRAWTAPSV